MCPELTHQVTLLRVESAQFSGGLLKALCPIDSTKGRAVACRADCLCASVMYLFLKSHLFAGSQFVKPHLLHFFLCCDLWNYKYMPRHTGDNLWVTPSSCGSWGPAQVMKLDGKCLLPADLSHHPSSFSGTCYVDQPGTFFKKKLSVYLDFSNSLVPAYVFVISF